MSCDSNDGDLKLTEEYKYLLSYIRPLIDQLDKSRDAQLCLLWLSKLEQCETWERHYRNKILSELCKQVKSHCLKPPFNVSPPSGPLQNVILRLNDWKTRKWVVQELSEVEGSTEEVFSSSSQHSIYPLQNIHIPAVTSCTKRLGQLRGSSKNKVHKSKDVDHCECLAIQKAYHERAQSDQLVIEKYQDIIKSLVSQQLKAEVSPSRLKKFQSTYEVKMAELVHALKRVQEENEALRKKLEYFKDDSEKVTALKNENEYLRKQIFDLEVAKNSLETKYKKSEEEKVLKLSDLISKLNESEKKLQEKEKRYTSLEKKYEDNYRNFEAEYQGRINEKNAAHAAEKSSLEKLLEEKKKEINDLKRELADQRAHFEQEISFFKQQMAGTSYLKKEDNKVKSLKSKTKKLEKIREHMTVLFQSQLEQILAKKDFYISTLEMQLKMNNSEGGGNFFTSDYNNSLEQKVSALEAQYKKLIEESEQQYIERRQLDLQKIHALEKQLLYFGGVAENIESDREHKEELSKTASELESSTKDCKA